MTGCRLLRAVSMTGTGAGAACTACGSGSGKTTLRRRVASNTRRGLMIAGIDAGA
jgi:hypothetical protein